MSATHAATGMVNRHDSTLPAGPAATHACGVYERTGPAADVLIFGEVETPRPGDGEVLVEIAASGANPHDTVLSLQPAASSRTKRRSERSAWLSDQSILAEPRRDVVELYGSYRPHARCDLSFFLT